VVATRWPFPSSESDLNVNIFRSAGRVRSGWRLLAFILLLGALFTAGALLLVRLEPSELGALLFWQGVLVLVAALSAGWLLLWWVDRRKPGALGYAWTAQTVRELWLGALIGAGSLAAVVGLLTLVGLIRYQPVGGTLQAYTTALGTQLVIFAVAAAAEEALFRGYGFQVLVEGVGPVVGTVLASAAFAAVHLQNPNIGGFALLNLFLAGVLLSVAYLRTRSLWFPTSLHLGWNWTMGGPLALPVSGLEFLQPPVYRATPTGANFLTGGAFGPEGGLAGTLAVALALWLVTRLGPRPAAELQRLEPLVDRRLGRDAPKLEEER
jgi:membrane protease YdiL (CAAX protease family)